MALLEARTFIGGVAVAVATFAAADVQSSTVTGSLKIDLAGTLAFANDPRDPALTLSGNFETINSFQNPAGSAPGGWTLNSTIAYGGQTTSPTLRDEGFTNGFGGPNGLRAEYRFNLALFSIASFMIDVIGETANGAGTTSGSGTKTFGGAFPVNWDISGLDLDTASRPITSSGNFTFTIAGTDDARTFLNVFDGFSGAAADLDGDREGGSFSASFNLAPIPVPAALPLLLSGVGLLGFMGWRRRQAQG